MSGEPYSDDVRRLFAGTAHAGSVDGASVRRDAQGVSVELSATAEGGRLSALRFRARGCPHLIAACEATCANLESRPVSMLREFRGADIMRDLSIPVEKMGRILVLEDAVAELADRL